MSEEYPQVYLIKEREFIKSQEDVLKLGRTKAGISNRGGHYPKGSRIISVLPVSDDVECENELKFIFSEIFKLRDDIGSEYFEGDEAEMLLTFSSIALKYGISGANPPKKYKSNRKNEISNYEHFKLDGVPVKVLKNRDTKTRYCEIYKYEDIIKHSIISKIVITNKKTLEGYWKTPNKPARKLFDYRLSSNQYETLPGLLREYISKEMKLVRSENYSCLYPSKRYYSMRPSRTKIFVSNDDIIDSNKFASISIPERKNYEPRSDMPPDNIQIELLVDKSLTDIRNKCYTDFPRTYVFTDDEYLVSTGKEFFMLKMATWDVTPIDSLPEMCCEKYNQEASCLPMIKFRYNSTNDSSTREIMNTLISDRTILDKYRRICKTVFMGNNEHLFFEDCYSIIPLLTIWLNNAMEKFCADKLEVKSRNRSTQGYYTVVSNRDSGNIILSIVDEDNLKLLNEEEKQSNIFVCCKSDKSPYNLDQYRKILKTIINEPLHDDNIFNLTELWFWNFVKYITT